MTPGKKSKAQKITTKKLYLHGLETFSEWYQQLWGPFYTVWFHMISAETRTVTRTLHIKFTHHLKNNIISLA